MGRFLAGIVIGLVIAPFIVLGWFKWGHPPVAVSDPPLPYERQIVSVPLHARIAREMTTSPIQPDEQNLVAGAEIYRDDCASCHGLHGQPSPFAAHMYPPAPPLWEKHHHGMAVGVSDDPPGETYWKVANGIRLSGMPAFSKILSQTQMWQVSVLLANADQPLPPQALNILNGQTASETAPPEAAPKPRSNQERH